jgi:histone-lysine N-methyltransferase SETMAR
MQFAENIQNNGQERGFLLHHGNARLHTARATQERIRELQWELLEHPPYSPDLAPRDFCVFGSLKKKHLGGNGR